MSQQPTDEAPDPSAWSADARWALAMADAAVVLLDPEGEPLHENSAARRIARRLAGGGEDPVEATRPSIHPAGEAARQLLALVPDGGWDTACDEGRWRGRVTVGDPEVVLEIKLYCDLGADPPKRMAVFGDVTAGAKREDALRRAKKKLAGTHEQLLQAEKMASIGQLAAGVAHEINNPIGYVHSNLGTLQEYTSALFGLIDAYAEAMEDEDPVRHRESLAATRQQLDIDFIAGDLPPLLKESREGIERVTRIVRDLKDFSHVERDAPMRPADLQQGLESTLNIVWNDLKYKARIEKHFTPMPLVECHRSEINQVLMNLLINAGQAIDGQGTIVIATGAGDGEAWISITDSGSGMPKEVIERIFDPFYTTKPVGHGTGLGLAICYGIIAKHNGRIEVSSTLGVGSTFRVVLPVTQPRVQEPGEA